MEQIFGFVDQNRDRFLGELFTLLRQPSISALNQGVTECAELLKRQLPVNVKFLFEGEEEVGKAAIADKRAGQQQLF